MTEREKFAYSTGMMIAKSMKAEGISPEGFDYGRFSDGVRAAMEGNAPELSVEESERIFVSHMNALKAEKIKVYKEGGERFLAENSKEERVVTTSSGLQYRVLKEGAGAKPTANDTVLVHYHGMLIDGTVFDSSVDRGEPITLPVNGVILGWQEALQMMNEGDKWRLFVPYNLAYGEQGAGRDIPPYSALVFDVELIKVQ